MWIKHKQVGLSLIELVVTIVILSIALVTITISINRGLSRSSDTLLELRTVTLAKAYMDEILGKRFDEKSASNGMPPCRDPALPGVPANRRCTLEGSFGPDGSETRATFDDVDDYSDIDEGEGGLNPLQDADGNTRTEYAGYRVVVDVRYINVAMMGDEEFGLGQNNELDDEYDAKAITVTITHTLLRTPFTYIAYKSNF